MGLHSTDEFKRPLMAQKVKFVKKLLGCAVVSVLRPVSENVICKRILTFLPQIFTIKEILTL